MKSLATILTVLATAQVSFAHGTPPVVANYTTTIALATEYLIENVGYSEKIFDSLIGVSTLQDPARKIRVLRFRFADANCAKDLEVYTKLDGSAALANKVVGCVP